MSTHIIKGPSFIWGITGVLVPGYRVEESEGHFTVAHGEDGKRYLISKTEGGHLLHRQELCLTGEVVEVSVT